MRLQHIVDGNVVSPRVYLLDMSRENYEMTRFTGGEFAFDVDMTKLPCGMNSALYLSEMVKDGGKSDLNTGGAHWGTGYCDGKFIPSPSIIPWLRRLREHVLRAETFPNWNTVCAL